MGAEMDATCEGRLQENNLKRMGVESSPRMGDWHSVLPIICLLRPYTFVYKIFQMQHVVRQFTDSLFIPQ